MSRSQLSQEAKGRREFQWPYGYPCGYLITFVLSKRIMNDTIVIGNGIFNDKKINNNRLLLLRQE